jgi:kynurenine formamidase
VPLRTELVDLSQPLRNDQPTIAGDPAVWIRSSASHERDGYVVTELQLGTHSGTHMDAPYHFLPEGERLDRYAVTRFVGQGIVLDLRGLDPDTVIEASAVSGALDTAGTLAPGSFAVLWLGWDSHFGTDHMWRNPYLSVDAGKLLADKGIGLLGTDAPSVDRTAVRSAYPIHRLLLARDILVVENLRGLEQLGAGPATFGFFPLLVADTEGAPVRAVAWPEGSEGSG